MSEGAAPAQGDEVVRLRNQLLSESDPAKRQEIVNRVLFYIQLRWHQHFEALAKEQNPERVLILLADLNDLIKQRKSGRQ